MCTRIVAELALEGAQVYTPESVGAAFWIRRRLVVVGPFSVTRLMPPRGESKLMTNWLCDQIMAGGGSGAYRTRQVRLMVDPMLMNNSGLPSISVIGSGNTEPKLNYPFIRIYWNCLWVCVLSKRNIKFILLLQNIMQVDQEIKFLYLKLLLQHLNHGTNVFLCCKPTPVTA